METFKQWLQRLTLAEKDKLVAAAGTSRGYLYLLSNGHRRASAEAAGKLEAASDLLDSVREGNVPQLYRGQVCDACRHCPYHPKMD
jgi:hypothetical protein